MGEKELNKAGGKPRPKTESEHGFFQQLTCKAPLDVEVLPDELEKGRRRSARGALHVLSCQFLTINKSQEQGGEKNEHATRTAGKRMVRSDQTTQSELLVISERT